MTLFATEKPLTSSWQLVPVSFALLKRNFWLIFALTIAASIAASIDTPSFTDLDSYQANSNAAISFLTFAGILWGVLFMPALIYAQLRISRGESVTFSDAARNGFTHFWRLVGLYILAGLIIVGGLLLLIVPGLILIRRYSLAPYYLIDQNLSIRESMKRSAAATKPVSGFIWGVLLVDLLFSLVGSALSSVTIIGLVLGNIFVAIYSFALPLRYLELEHPADAKRTIKANTTA